MKKIIFILPLFFQFLNAQEIDSQTLFTVDDEVVTVEEFERVYTKNNINNQADYSKESLEEYLNLFINFKLKVKEAEMLQMDTISSINKELESYKVQLVKNYANDKKVSDELIKEAFERSQYEVDASHILVLWPNDFPSAADSARALKAINAIKEKATVDNFNTLAKTSSQDPSAKNNEGRLSYLTVFQTVYPFENALYNSKVGEISDPVATQFGYHLVLVHDKRPARGKITTAHILIKSKESDSDVDKAEAEKKANGIYNDLMNGEISFEEAVLQYSQDKKTKYNSGKLPELSSAEMLTEFADAAFAIANDNEIAPPVKTTIGWHIIKRISKTEIPNFEDAEFDLSNKVARDSRSNVAMAVNVEDSKKKFGFSQNKENIKELESILLRVVNDTNTTYDKEIFTIGNKTYTQQDFIDYSNKAFVIDLLDKNNDAKIRKEFKKYQDKRIQKYRESHLAEINEDYKNLMQEYHDGILLFELTNKEVWSKAVSDTVGLKEYYEANKDAYMWNERADIYTYTFANENVANKGYKLLAKGKSNEVLEKKLNKKETLLKISNQKLEKESFNKEELEFVKGSEVETVKENGEIEYVLVKDILAPTNKKLEETKGYVISDYQSYLENQWIDNLKNKYTVELNKDVFQSLIK